MEVPAALTALRSRSGLEAYWQAGCLQDAGAIALALQRSEHAVTQALLLPFAPAAVLGPAAPAMESVVEDRLRKVTPGSPLHLALVEAVRRQYRLHRQAVDGADKQAIRAAQGPPRG